MIPNDVEELLHNRFGYPNIIIAQVATLSTHDPDIRSMGLFDIDIEGRLIFLTNRGSHKWTQLSQLPTIAVLLLNLKQDAQIIARGDAELLTLGSHRDLLEQYWLRTPHGAQLTYEHQHPEGEYVSLNISAAKGTAPDNFGIIRVTPTNWEILDMDVNNYPASRRICFDRHNKDWKKTRLNAI
ncbi:MAG: pyridoxamine 5'-phosphate oxidase family protein [Chlamydiales bacterium]